MSNSGQEAMGQQKAAVVQDAQTIENRLNWQVLEDLVLTRLLFGLQEGETEVQLRKDLHPLVMQQMSAAEWRTSLGQVIVGLVDQGFMRPVRANAYKITEKCEPRVQAFLQVSRTPKAAWHEIRDGHLIALALNEKPSQQLINRVASAEGLRSALLAQAFKLPYDLTTATVEQIRFGLAKVAEQKGLTSGIRTTPIEENNITQKEAVMMAAKLLKSGHVVESDGELMACLAQEVVGAVNESAQELRQMLFRRLISARESSELQLGKVSSSIRETRETEPQTILSEPPALPDFAREVQTIAQHIATGWPGNKRAFISHIWAELRQKFPHWNLAEEGYKELILNAHRAGHLRLAIADLRDKTNVDDVASSRISYKNSEWHFVRADE